MKVEVIEMYPKGFKLSITEIPKDTAIATVKNIFLEWQNDSILWEQKAKSKKSTENKIPPINVTIEARERQPMINLCPIFPQSNFPKISKLAPLNLDSSATSNKRRVGIDTRAPMKSNSKNAIVGPTIFTPKGRVRIPMATKDLKTLKIKSITDFLLVFDKR